MIRSTGNDGRLMEPSCGNRFKKLFHHRSKAHLHKYRLFYVLEHGDKVGDYEYVDTEEVN